ncbi:MAG TPA: SDR family NAD(P)-dependent oxidoreductase [Anaerolineae bacterium]|nr:SDR family NAD(P)-dependent oxidoreductase [Anaerolineae bacterium]
MALTDRVVAIAGAAGGLGPTVARAFVATGARLAVAGRNQADLIQLLDSMQLPDDRRLASAVDLTDATATQGWAEQIAGKFGRVDVLLHLVGGYKGGTAIAEIPAADWDFVHNLLIKTTLNAVRAFVTPLKANGWGRFITVSSPRAQTPSAKTAIYAMSKAASEALVLALADEFKGTGATANIVVVNSIATPEQRAAEPDKDYSKATSAEEIAAAMLYLCSDAASAINGARLALTGRG